MKTIASYMDLLNLPNFSCCAPSLRWSSWFDSCRRLAYNRYW